MTNNELARRILEVVALSMCELTTLFRKMPDFTITVGQFRVMNMLARGIDCVSRLAEVYGVSEPAMSKMVDLLVRLGIANRELYASDRRQFVLALTEEGNRQLEFLRERMQLEVGKRLQDFRGQDKDVLVGGLDQLQNLFGFETQTKRQSQLKES